MIAEAMDFLAFAIPLFGLCVVACWIADSRVGDWLIEINRHRWSK